MYYVKKSKRENTSKKEFMSTNLFITWKGNLNFTIQDRTYSRKILIFKLLCFSISFRVRLF